MTDITGTAGGANVRGVPAARWMITVLATVVSTWALDLFAAAAGVLMAASPLLDEASREMLFGFLVITYAAWAAGLRVNLTANWRLLVQTGTSTNALSKAGFEIARRRTSSERVQRAAAAVGYVIIEVAKEAPYYAGAFGAALLSDGVDSIDALVFLGGANLGAAAYEYGVAGLTGAYLRRRSDLRGRSPRVARRRSSASPYASFDIDWAPLEYLSDYYRVVEPDERATIAFFVDAMRHVEPGHPVLLFGVGPTLHHVFLTTNIAAEIHLAEYLPANLREIERWLAREPEAHDWRPFVEYTLRCEGVDEPTEEEVRAREDLTRAKITALLAGDARRTDPLDGGGTAPYRTVISAYCADSATADPAAWAEYLRNIAGLVGPGGLFVTAALRNCAGYIVGGKTFPSASVDEASLRRELQVEFDWAHGIMDICDLSAHRSQGYTSILLARVRKRTVAAVRGELDACGIGEPTTQKPASPAHQSPAATSPIV